MRATLGRGDSHPDRSVCGGWGVQRMHTLACDRGRAREHARVRVGGRARGTGDARVGPKGGQGPSDRRTINYLTSPYFLASDLFPLINWPFSPRHTYGVSRVVFASLASSEVTQ